MDNMQNRNFKELSEKITDPTGRSEFVWGKYKNTRIADFIKNRLGGNIENIMDYGAGNGKTGIKIAGEFNAEKLTLVDSNRLMDLEVKRIADNVKNIKYVGVNDGETPDLNEARDLIMLNDVINFIPDDKILDLLGQLENNLTDNGIIVITQTNDKPDAVSKFLSIFERISKNKPDLLKRALLVTHDDHILHREGRNDLASELQNFNIK